MMDLREKFDGMLRTLLDFEVTRQPCPAAVQDKCSLRALYNGMQLPLL